MVSTLVGTIFIRKQMKEGVLMGMYLNPGNMAFTEVINSEYVDKTGLIDIVNGSINTKNKLNTIIFGNTDEIIKSSQEIGHIFQQQKGIMLDLQKRKKERENKRKKRNIILFFNHNGYILPLEFNANKSIEDVLKKYIDMTQLKNVKFKYKNIELLENDSNHLLNEFECKGLVTGSEILVEDKV